MFYIPAFSPTHQECRVIRLFKWMLIKAISSVARIKASHLWRFCLWRGHKKNSSVGFASFLLSHFYFPLSSLTALVPRHNLKRNKGGGWITCYNTYSWRLRSGWLDPLARDTTKVASAAALSSPLPIRRPRLLLYSACSFLLNYLLKSPLFKPLSFSHEEPTNRQQRGNKLWRLIAHKQRLYYFGVILSSSAFSPSHASDVNMAHLTQWCLSACKHDTVISRANTSCYINHAA